MTTKFVAHSRTRFDTCSLGLSVLNRASKSNSKEVCGGFVAVMITKQKHTEVELADQS